MKLTDSKIKSIKKPEKRQYIWEDGSGFGIRVEPTGTKSFVLWYRFNGKSEGVTLGKYPKIGLAEARAKAAKIREKIARGIDPRIQIEAERQANRETYLIKDLVSEYLEKWAKPRKRSWREDERILNKEVIPFWGRRKAKDIHRRDVILLLDGIIERGAPIQANRTFAVARKMFNFAVSRSILDSTPTVGITSRAKENRRERVLSEDEIRAFWNGLEQAKMAEGTKLALKLQLVTAQRKGEVIGAEWSDFDLNNRWWTVPGEKTKNGLSHRIPLSRLASDLLKGAKNNSSDSRWVFPGARGNNPITGPAVDHAVRNNKDILGINHFTPHDLRRTAASMMTGAGTPRLTVAKILNHVESGVTAIYDRHSYDNEKRQALEAWGRRLEEIINGKSGKIIEFSR